MSFSQHNTLEYLGLVVIALAVAFYASSELQSLLIEVVDRVAQMITGGY